MIIHSKHFILPSYLPLIVILLLISGIMGKAASIDGGSAADSSVTSSVAISFDDPNVFFLDLEAGEDSAQEQLAFTAKCVNCNARITGLLTTPPSPAGLSWDWSFLPHNNNVITLTGVSEFHARVKVHVKHNDIDTVPAGLYKGGVMTIIIDAL